MNWKSILRRSAALCLATVTVYITVLTGGAAAAGDAFTAIGENQSLVLSLVKSELGAAFTSPEAAALSLWGNLALSESALLSSMREVDALLLADTSNERAPMLASEGVETTPPLDPEDPAEDTPTAPAEADDIIAKQFLPAANYENAGGVYIFNRTSKVLDVAALLAANCPVTLPNISEPQVLIVHTHATEAYQPNPDDPYEVSDPYRTLDNSHNITRVGAEVKSVLEGLGISVIHDTTHHDYPNYNGSYTRSAATIESYLEQYPTIQVVLDIHRDAIVSDEGAVFKALTTVDGEDVAQILLVVGTDEGGQAHPSWQQNLVFAADVQQSMNLLFPTLARPVTLRGSRFNQQYRVGSLLVEVGTHGNTLEESIDAGRHFARSLGLVLLQNKID